MKEELSDFLKTAYEYGKVKDLKEAFEKYPVQEEWHKGKIGNNHFFVIIDQDNTAVPIENFGRLVSSNLNKLKFKTNKLLEKDETNNLHKDSLVKTDVIYKIPNEQIIFKIGIVSYEKIEEYRKSSYDSLKNQN